MFDFFSDLKNQALQAQVTAIGVLLVEKGVFTVEEFQATVAEVGETMKKPEYQDAFREEVLRQAKQKTQG